MTMGSCLSLFGFSIASCLLQVKAPERHYVLLAGGSGYKQQGYAVHFLYIFQSSVLFWEGEFAVLSPMQVFC